MRGGKREKKRKKRKRILCERSCWNGRPVRQPTVSEKQTGGHAATKKRNKKLRHRVTATVQRAGRRRRLSSSIIEWGNNYEAPNFLFRPKREPTSIAGEKKREREGLYAFIYRRRPRADLAALLPFHHPRKTVSMVTTLDNVAQ